MADKFGIVKNDRYDRTPSKIKRSKSLTRKRITIIDAYLNYPYKNRDPLTVMGRNSFPKKEIVPDHQYSLTLQEYKTILDELIKEFIRLLIQGITFKMPHGLGFFSITKHRKVKTDIRFLEYYSFYFTWKKTRRGFTNQFYWGFRPLQKVYTQMYEAIRKDSTLVNNYPNLKQNVRTFRNSYNETKHT